MYILPLKISIISHFSPLSSSFQSKELYLSTNLIPSFLTTFFISICICLPANLIHCPQSRQRNLLKVLSLLPFLSFKSFNGFPLPSGASPTSLAYVPSPVLSCPFSFSSPCLSIFNFLIFLSVLWSLDAHASSSIWNALPPHNFLANIYSFFNFLLKSYYIKEVLSDSLGPLNTFWYTLTKNFEFIPLLC